MPTKSISWFLHHVHGQLGVCEHPLGSNKQEYGVQFGWDGVSWCVECGWCLYDDAGVVWPVKTASCVVIYDAMVKLGLRYDSDNCVPGDAIIRSWLGETRAHLTPGETHFQIVVDTKIEAGKKYLGVIGGNQGAGYVGPDIEWVETGIPTILGGLAFHKLFGATQKPGANANKGRDGKKMPKAKSHPTALTKQSAAAIVTETKKLDDRNHQVQVGHGDRKKLRRLGKAIARVLAIKGGSR